MKWMVAPVGFVMAVAALGAQQARDAGDLGDDLQLRGRVVDGRDGAALPRARLVVSAGDRHLLPVFTDDGGRFVVSVPPADGYLVRVSKAMYAADVVPLPTEAVGREMTVALSRGAALEGRVLDATGTPIVDVTIAARRQAASDAPAAMPPFATETDDRGDFRLGGLPAGRYEVRVLGFDFPISIVWNDTARQRTAGFVESAFSAAPDAATPSFVVDLEPGDELVGRDLIVQAAPGAACQRKTRAVPPDPAATSTIRGRISAAGGGPLACASVMLLPQRPQLPPRTAVTDADGRYLIQHLPAGSYTLGARHAGHMTLQYGQQRAGDSGTMLTLGPGEGLDRLDVALSRGSAIFGTVVDERGEPLAGVSVRALELRALDGRIVATVASGVRSERPTDDRGHYRLIGLLPGAYLVSASADAHVSGTDSDPGHGYAPVYFPGTTDVFGASRVHVDVGRDAGADLVFVATPTARIAGVALGEDGRPMRSGVVALSVSHRSGAPMIEPRQAQLGPDGSFTFTNVPSGDYVVQVMGVAPLPAGSPPPDGAPRAVRTLPLFGSQYVTVTDPVPSPVTIRVSRGATMEGHVRIDGSAEVRRLGLLAVPTDWDQSPIAGIGPLGFSSGFWFREDGTFSYAGLHGPQRISLRAPPEGHYLTSVIIDGQDVTDRPFDFGADAVVYADAEVVVSSQAAALEGHATGERGERAGHYGVVVFPADRTLWFRSSRHLKFARADQDGAFQVNGLPPGSYLVAAVDRIEGTPGAGEWQDPALLEQLAAQARRVTLVEGERVTTTVRLIRRQRLPWHAG